MKQRLFIAVPLSGKARNVLFHVQERLKEKIGKDSIKWVKKNNLHQTMVFLGYVEERKIAAVKKTMKVLKKIPSFKLSLSKLGFFPDQNRPQVIWVGLGRELDGLKSAYHQLRLSLQRAEFSFSTRFFPHVALGRVRLKKDKFRLSKHAIEQINDFISSQEMTFFIKKVVLFKSRLTPSGPIYTPIFDIKLAK